MSNKTPPKEFYETEFHEQRFQRSVSLDSWILDSFHELYKDELEIENFEGNDRVSSNFKGDNLIHSKAPERCSEILLNNFEQSNLTPDRITTGTSSYTSCVTPKKNHVRDDANEIIDSDSPVLLSNPQCASNGNNSYTSRNLKKNPNTPSFFSQLLKRKSSGSLYRTRSTGSVNDDKCSNNRASSIFRRDNNSAEQQAQVKAKLRSVWNTMKYGWRLKREVNLKVDSAVWLLGECYHNKLNDSALLSQDIVKQLKLDVLSKIWFTYRVNFPLIPGTDLVSDTGWGCMLRCGQMMMAQALVCHFLRRDWRYTCDQSKGQREKYKMVLRWFGDCLSEKSPFSLHNLVILGQSYGRKAGDWYGPTHVAHVLRDALIDGKINNPGLRNLCMYVASDGIVFKQDVIDICLDSPLPHIENPSINENYTLPCIEKETSINACDSRINYKCDSLDSTVQPSPFKESSSSKNYTSPSAGCSFNTPENIASINTCASRISSRFDSPIHETNPHKAVSPKLNVQHEVKSVKQINIMQDKAPYQCLASCSILPSNWRSLILFVSVRLGNDRINPFYVPCLKSLLAFENCIGIIGGRPKHALYFIGFQEDKLIYMDPHSCQPAINLEDDFNEKSFHSSSIRTMLFTEMDPSCSIGFYFRRKEDFEFFVDRFLEITAPMKENMDYPVFSLAEGKRAEIEELNSKHFSQRRLSSFNNMCAEDDYILL